MLTSVEVHQVLSRLGDLKMTILCTLMKAFSPLRRYLLHLFMTPPLLLKRLVAVAIDTFPEGFFNGPMRNAAAHRYDSIAATLPETITHWKQACILEEVLLPVTGVFLCYYLEKAVVLSKNFQEAI